MLSEDRQYYVTGSQAHRVMAEHEKELSAGDFTLSDFPEREQLISFVGDFYKSKGSCPLVRDAKAAEIVVSGAQIKEVYAYLESLKPVFTKGMESYAREIVKHQLVSEREENYSGRDTERGNEQEHLAVAALESKLGYEFDFTGDEQEFFHLDYLGLTPDGAHYDDTFMVDQGLEVKCPKQDIHMKNLCTLKNQDDLLAEYPEYYWQCMTGLAVTTASVWHFGTFNKDYKTERGDFRLVHIPIYPVKSHIDLLLKRSEAVVKRSKQILEEITQ